MTTAVQQALVLDANERCDRCSGSAKIKVRLAEGGELVFCSHHGNKYAEQLVKVAVEYVMDEGYVWRVAELLEAK